jgi:hypothetical protein
MQNILIYKTTSYFKTTLSFLIIIWLDCLPGNQAIAQWSSDPTVNTPVNTTPYEQSLPRILTDGAGGVFMLWDDLRNSVDYNVYAQHINAAGAALWVTNGVAVITHPAQQVDAGMVSDGAGGLIILIGDSRNGEPDIYAQRINASGQIQWATNGVPVCTAPVSQGIGGVIPDGTGGAIMCWRDRRAGGAYDIYAQRIDGSGVSQWLANGVPICTNQYEQDECSLVSDGAGGAIITWYDHRNGNYDIYAQRINSAGTAQWTAGGKIVCNAVNDQLSPFTVSDGAGGAIITWDDNRTDGITYDIYAQRINSAGVAQWTANGVAYCTSPGDQFIRDFDSDGSGGIIVVWDDKRSGTDNVDVYAQRINGSGVAQWTPGGKAICTAINNQQLCAVAVDTSGGGAIITWYDERSYTVGSSMPDIYAQGVDGSGVTQWATNGVVICNEAHEQYNCDIVSDGAGGAIISWLDFRHMGTTDIDNYIQNVHADGTIGSGPISVVNCASGNNSITSNVTGSTYQWQSDTGSGFTNISDNSNYTGTNSLTLQINNIPSAWNGYLYRCLVDAGNSQTFHLRILNNWMITGNSTWENPANWNCGIIPDANSDVVISSGTVVVSANTTVRTLTVAPGVSFTVAPGILLTITH